MEERCDLLPALAPVWTALASPTYRDGDAQRWPALTKLLSRARLALLEPSGEHEMSGRRLVDVEFERDADDYLQLHLRRGSETLARVRGAWADVLSCLEAPGELQDLDGDRTVDRIVRAATGGLADSSQIGLGLALADIVDLDAWERSLHASAEDTALARRIRDALESAPPDAREVAVPEHGVARRVVIPPAKLRGRRREPDGLGLEAFVDVAGARELALPAVEVWTVTGVEDGILARTPQPRPPRPDSRAVARPTPPGGTNRGPAIAIVTIAIIVLVIWLLRR